MGTKSAWTQERRARQSLKVRETRPWLSSTGPKSAEGKARSSQNARLNENIQAARQQSDKIMSAALYIFGRERWPKGLGRRRQRL